MKKKLVKVCLAAQTAGVQFGYAAKTCGNWGFNGGGTYTIDKKNYALLVDFIAGSQDFDRADILRVKKYFDPNNSYAEATPIKPVPATPVVEPLVRIVYLGGTGRTCRVGITATEIRAMQRGMRGLHGELQSHLAKAIMGYVA